jgi:hypothetical protein
MLEELQEYGAWWYALGYTREGARHVLPGGMVSEPKAELGFGVDDVAEILATDDGENDERQWVGVFRLTNGQFAFVEGGCDYTGWDCQSSAYGTVASSVDELVRWAMDDDARSRLADALDPVTDEQMSAAAAGLRRLARSLNDLS